MGNLIHLNSDYEKVCKQLFILSEISEKRELTENEKDEHNRLWLKMIKLEKKL